MADIDLTDLSLDELKKLQRDVNKAVESYHERQRQDALAAAEAKAKEYGYSLADLTGAPKKGKGKARGATPPKYRHTEDPTLTWSGRGRKPGWIKEAEDAGRNTDDFLIAS